MTSGFEFSHINSDGYRDTRDMTGWILKATLEEIRETVSVWCSICNRQNWVKDQERREQARLQEAYEALRRGSNNAVEEEIDVGTYLEEE
ncbi:MAG: hypothetical protein JRN21_09645 [Nitrososphaerota archaeon]|nr:hypothetical protein [Nitrososphaerota archaeon]